MSKRITRLLLSALLASLCTLTIKSFYTLSQTLEPQDNLTISAVRLGLIPETGYVLAGEPVTVNLVAETDNHTLTALESHLAFDPSVLSIAAEDIAGVHLPFTLPNCDGDESQPPCPFTPIIKDGHVSFYTSVPCEEAGCELNTTSGLVTLASFTFTTVVPGRHSIDLISVDQDEGAATMLAAIGFEENIAELISDTHISSQECLLPHDFDADGLVSVADIMFASSRWQAHLGDEAYDGGLDIDKNGTINIVDVQTIANVWNQTCIN